MFDPVEAARDRPRGPPGSGADGAGVTSAGSVREGGAKEARDGASDQHDRWGELVGGFAAAGGMAQPGGGLASGAVGDRGGAGQPGAIAHAPDLPASGHGGGAERAGDAGRRQRCRAAHPCGGAGGRADQSAAGGTGGSRRGGDGAGEVAAAGRRAVVGAVAAVGRVAARRRRRRRRRPTTSTVPSRNATPPSGPSGRWRSARRSPAGCCGGQAGGCGRGRRRWHGGRSRRRPPCRPPSPLRAW
jgi:hypothetical protein